MTETPKTLVVIGASRGIGRACVTEALSRGARVRAVARKPEALRLEHPELETVAADATDAAALAAVLDGADAVLLTLGVPLGPRTVLRPVHLFSDATRAVIAAMAAAGCRRLLAVTGFGTSESRAAVSALESVAFRGILGRAYDDKTRQEALIRESGLDWTIARPVILTNGRSEGRYKVLTSPESWRNGMIPRAEVADFLVGAALDGTYIGEAPVLAR